MAVTEYRDITKVNWFKRLGSSLKGIFTGLLVFILAFPLLFWNESRAVKTAKRLAEGAGSVLSVGTDSVDPANEGKLVHVSGMVAVHGEVADADFGISTPAVALSRSVEIYQWVEDEESEVVTKDGKEVEKVTYTYSKQWCDSPVDSSRFKERGHDNGPAEMRFGYRDVCATDVTLGAFSLSESNIRRIGGEKAYAFPAGFVPPETLAGAQLANGVVYVPIDAALPAPVVTVDTNGVTNVVQNARSVAAQPQIGDLRVTFAVVEPHEVSIVAAQVGNSFGGWKASDGNSIMMQRDGVHDAAEMFESAQASNKLLTRVLRFVGFLIMFLGVRAVLAPLAVLVDVIPLVNRLVSASVSIGAAIVAAVFSLVTIALAWVTFRPLVAIPLLVVAVALAVLGFRRKRSAR